MAFFINFMEYHQFFGAVANHLAKVMQDFSRARLVQSVRGAGSGYCFSGNVKRVTLYDIVILFEDIDSHEVGFSQTGHEADIGLAINKVLAEIERIAVSTLKSITLTKLLKQMKH